MTAPAIAPAPTAVEQTPVAPVVETQAPESIESTQPETLEQPRGVEGIIDKITRRAIPEDAAPLETDPTGEPAADPAGESLVGGTSDTNATPETPASLVSEIKADEPEGEVVLRARDPKTGQFSDMDQTRTYELSIKDKETGETRVYQKDLPGLMRLAKDGISMQKSREELGYYRTQVPQWQQQTTELTRRVEGLQSLALELLSAPEDVVVARRNEYAAQNTPEHQLARRAADLQAQEAAFQARQTAAQRNEANAQHQALAARIGPVVQEVEGLVGKETAAGQLALAAMPLMVNGIIPPQAFPQLEAYVQGPYREWAKAEAAKRTTSQTQATQQLEAAKATQARAQLAARQAGMATRPVGGNAGNANAAPVTKPKNVNDAIDRIIRRPLAAGA